MRDDAIPGMVYVSDMTAYSLRCYIRALVAGAVTDPKKREQNIALCNENVAKVTEAMKRYESAITSAEDRSNFEALKQRRAAFASAREAYFALLKSGKPEEISAFEQDEFDPAFVLYRDQMAMMLKWNQDVANSVTNQIVATAHQARRVSLIVSSFSILVAVGLGFIIIRSTNKALRRIATALTDASAQVTSASG